MLTQNKGYFISERQFCLLFLQISLPFKIASLPSLIAKSAGKDGIFVIAALAVLEIAAAIAVFYVCKKGGLIKACQTLTGVKKATAICISVLIALFSVSKLILNTAEFLDYISLTLFDDIGWVFVIITLLPVIYALVRSTATVGGRCAQICSWVFFAVMFLSLLFNRYKLDQPLKPFLQNDWTVIPTTTFNVLFRGFDFLPIAFVAVIHSPNEKKPNGFKLSLFGYAVLLSAFYVIAYMTYGNALQYADNVFARLAVFHSITSEIKVFDFHIIVCWLITALLNACTLTYAVKCLSESLFKRDVLSPIALIAVGVLLLFAEGYHSISSLFSHYIWNALTVLLVIALALFAVFYKKEEKNAA